MASSNEFKQSPSFQFPVDDKMNNSMNTVAMDVDSQSTSSNAAPSSFSFFNSPPSASLENFLTSPSAKQKKKKAARKAKQKAFLNELNDEKKETKQREQAPNLQAIPSSPHRNMEFKSSEVKFEGPSAANYQRLFEFICQTEQFAMLREASDLTDEKVQEALKKIGDVHTSDNKFYYRENKESTHCMTTFMNAFLEDEENCKLLLEEHTRKYNLRNRGRKPGRETLAAPACLSIIPNVIFDQNSFFKHCLITCSKSDNVNYGRIIGALNKTAKKLNEARNNSDQYTFEISTDYDPNFSILISKLLIELGRPIAEDHLRLCAEKFFMDPVAQMIYFNPFSQTLGSMNIWLYPFRRDRVYGKDATTEEGRKVFEPAFDCIDVGNFRVPHIPCCTSCQANQYAALLIPLAISSLNEMRKEQLKKEKSMSSPEAYTLLGKQRQTEGTPHGLFPHATKKRRSPISINFDDQQIPKKPREETFSPHRKGLDSLTLSEGESAPEEKEEKRMGFNAQ